MIRLAIPSKRSQVLAKNATLRAGQSYERRVSAWLEREFGMHSQVEFEHEVHGACHRFIPDGLLFDFRNRKLVVVEIKSQCSEVAQRQVKRYVDHLREWFPGQVTGLIICSSDPFYLDHDLHVQSPLDAFNRTYSLLAVSPRLLPRIKDGLHVGESTVADLVRAARGGGNGAGRHVSDVVLPLVERARSAQ